MDEFELTIIDKSTSKNDTGEPFFRLYDDGKQGIGLVSEKPWPDCHDYTDSNEGD